jgi:hypothetical protein
MRATNSGYPVCAGVEISRVGSSIAGKRENIWSMSGLDHVLVVRLLLISGLKPNVQEAL